MSLEKDLTPHLLPVYRPATLTDLQRILEINQQSFDARIDPKQWSSGFNSFHLSSNIINDILCESQKRDDVFFIVCEYDHQVIGYTIAFLVNPSNVEFFNGFIREIMGDRCKDLVTLDFSQDDVVCAGNGGPNLWKQIISDKKLFRYTFWFQIAIDRAYLRRGFGSGLTLHVVRHLADKNKSEFTVGAVEVFPAFNIAQFEFLYKRERFKILAIIRTFFRENEDRERCILFYRLS